MPNSAGQFVIGFRGDETRYVAIQHMVSDADWLQPHRLLFLPPRYRGFDTPDVLLLSFEDDNLRNIKEEYEYFKQSGRDMFRSMLSTIVVCNSINAERLAEEFIDSRRYAPHFFFAGKLSVCSITARSMILHAIEHAIIEMMTNDNSSSNGEEKNRSSITRLVSQLDGISVQLKSLKINSVSDLAVELDNICVEFGSLDQKDENVINGPLLKALNVFDKLFDTLGTERGAQILVSGAVAGLLGSGGATTTTIFALTMAAWRGQESFRRAIADYAVKREK